MAYKGKFKPKNMKKYNGDPNNIIYRSLWELKMMSYLDQHPDVLSWASEEFFIPYLSPVDNKMHRYFPDFYVKRRNKQGIVETLIIEIKPKAQTVPPKQKNNKRLVEHTLTYAVNQAKWTHAQKFCEEHGFQFRILTEDDLGV